MVFHDRTTRAGRGLVTGSRSSVATTASLAGPTIPVRRSTLPRYGPAR